MTIAGRKKLRTKTGLTLDIEFELRDRDDLRVYGFDPKANDEPVAWVDVDVWPQRKLAKVNIAGLKSAYQGQGVGTALYPMVNRETKRLFRLPLSSDDEGNRSEAAERLWKRLVSLGLAQKTKDRYVMEAFVPSLRQWFGEQ